MKKTTDLATEELAIYLYMKYESQPPSRRLAICRVLAGFIIMAENIKLRSAWINVGAPKFDLGGWVRRDEEAE